MWKIPKNDALSSEIIKIAGVRFTSRDNLLLWCREYIPALIPYECYVDVYTYLNRLMDVADGSLHDLVDQHKLGLSGDDAVTLSSFQSATPKIFGKTNTATVSS